MNPGKQPYILNASSNLFGICFVLIAGLKLTNLNDASFVDEINAFAALNFLAACTLSYLSIRNEKRGEQYERWADYLFLTGLFSLAAAIAFISTGLL
jgi:hypothetical protein